MNLSKELGIALMVLIVGCAEVKKTTSEYDEFAVPDENRFLKQVFLDYLTEPIALEILPDGQILFIQRKGGIYLYDIEEKRIVVKDSLPVFYGMEDGLMGLALDPKFEHNQWLYLYYSPVGNAAKQHLSRFRLTSKGIVNEKVMLVVPTQRDECCHTGGAIEFDGKGLLYLSTGDDTNPFESKGYAPLDQRPGRESWDANRSSSNTNDLRGKILRIKPEPDGTYSIPEGNLFVDEDPLTRPEIYVMGCRNPYRISIDKDRNLLFWGDVGPDAQKEKEDRGPRGHDEINMASKPGNYGWPLFIANNQAYSDWNFKKKNHHGFFDPIYPVNTSPNNTGLKKLPPAKPAMIYYPYANSSKFPILGSGGRTAMVGPVYNHSKYLKSRNRFPAYFDQRLLIYDWIRDWVFTVKVDDVGQASDFQSFMPNTSFSNPIDMQYGPDGQLYMLEYGNGWFTTNSDARLSRINFTSGNRAPVLEAELSTTAGGQPLTITLDASKSYDYEEDLLSFKWRIDEEIFTDPTIKYTFPNNGIYYPRITIRDTEGNKVTRQFKVEVGNETAEIDLKIGGNKTFHWPGRKIVYDVTISDKEDGAVGKGISRKDVFFDITLMDGFDKSEVLGHQIPISSGQTLIENSDCFACHKMNETSVGPSFEAVADKYKDDPYAMDYLTNKIINGGGGVWGEHVMSAHPDFTTDQTKSIVNYIMKIGETKPFFPLSGVYSMPDKATDKRVIFNANYTDKGAHGLSGRMASELTTLRSNHILAIDFDQSKKVRARKAKKGNPSHVLTDYDESWVMYKSIDLTGIKYVTAHVSLRQTTEALLSLRLGAPDGPEISNVVLHRGDRKYYNMEIPGSNDTEDVYVVFIKKGSDEPLMLLYSLTFNAGD